MIGYAKNEKNDMSRVLDVDKSTLNISKMSLKSTRDVEVDKDRTSNKSTKSSLDLRRSEECEGFSAHSEATNGKTQTSCSSCQQIRGDVAFVTTEMKSMRHEMEDWKRLIGQLFEAVRQPTGSESLPGTRRFTTENVSEQDKNPRASTPTKDEASSFEDLDESNIELPNSPTGRFHVSRLNTSGNFSRNLPRSTSRQATRDGRSINMSRQTLNSSRSRQNNDQKIKYQSSQQKPCDKGAKLTSCYNDVKSRNNNKIIITVNVSGNNEGHILNNNWNSTDKVSTCRIDKQNSTNKTDFTDELDDNDKFEDALEPDEFHLIRMSNQADFDQFSSKSEDENTHSSSQRTSFGRSAQDNASRGSHTGYNNINMQ